MRSVAIKGVKEFEIKEINEPVVDGVNVIIDVKKAGICGSDIHYWVSGNPVGLVMGHEYCGIVKDPGSRKDLQHYQFHHVEYVMHVLVEIHNIV